jgi:threonine-phosphate decarboxylase
MTVTHGGNLFEIARDRGWDWRDVADFSASINPLGPAPAVLDAIRGALDRIVHYPEREPSTLRRALAGLWSVDEDRILLGNGATELLHWFARIGQSQNRDREGADGAVTLAVPVFSEFHRAWPTARCTPAIEPSRWPDDGLLVLTQPLNPTGATVDTAARNPLFIDESFLDFTGLPSAATTRDDIWVLRSLTKFYALPGLRVGALIGPPETVARLRSQREPWQVNVLAEAAALAAIADRDHARRTLAFVESERAYLAANLPVRPEPSVANYLFVPLPHEAAPLCAFLLDRKILIRDCTGTPGVDGPAVRVAVRTRAENDRLIAAWKEFACAL